MDRARRIALNNMRLMERLIGDLDVKWVKPNATVLAYLKLNVKNTYDFSEKLFEKYSVLVNPGECFEMPGYVRIGLGSTNTEFLSEALSLFISYLREYK
jgi:Aspartate/tyrosine/aromatic aminotransferase